MKRVLSVLAGWLLIGSFGYGQETLDLFPEHPGALTCWTETRSAPRPLRLYFLKIALDAKDLEVIALPGDDPDGSGPAESRLTNPVDLFNRFKALAAVNANAFAGLSNEPAAIPNWYEGQPVDIHGLVVSMGKPVSPVESQRTPFWLDSENKPHLGDPATGNFVKEAVADWFSPLLMDGRVIPNAGDPALHPRTALGFDNSGSWLMLVVVDGRQPGFSEGVTLRELAEILQSKGCAQSINLDGGGSSIMLIRESGKELRTLNRPSGKTPRPVPVMLGVRKSVQK